MRLKLVCLALLGISAVWAQFPKLPQLTAEAAARLEADLAATPGNVEARSQLLWYYLFPGRATENLHNEARRKHALWLIRHQPDANVLTQPAGLIDPGDDPEGYSEASAAWRDQLAKPEVASRVLLGAIAFFQAADRKLAFAIVDRGMQAFPKENLFLQRKGMLYAYSLAGVKNMPARRMPQLDLALAKSEEADQARKELLASDQPQLLIGALMSLPLLYPGYFSKPDAAQDLLTFADKLAARLRELDPESPVTAQLATMIELLSASRQRDNNDKVSSLEKALGNASTDQVRFYVLGIWRKPIWTRASRPRPPKKQPAGSRWRSPCPMTGIMAMPSIEATWCWDGSRFPMETHRRPRRDCWPRDAQRDRRN